MSLVGHGGWSLSWSLFSCIEFVIVWSCGCASALESGQTASVAPAAAVKSRKHNAGLECCILEWGDAGFELASLLLHVKQSRR